MNYSVSREDRQDLCYTTADKLQVGDIAQIDSCEHYLNGHWLLVTYGNQVVDLNTPTNTWDNSGNCLTARVRKINDGEVIKLVGTECKN